MQEIYAKTRGDLFKDLLNIQQLTVAYHRPDNIRDLLIPSKLKYCNGQENQVEFYLKDADLIDCVEEINYKQTRNFQISQEKAHLINEVKQINMLALPANKQHLYNPCSKKLQWIHNVNNVNS